MEILNELNSRLEFYKNVYSDKEKEKKELNKIIKKQEKDLKNISISFIENKYGKDIDEKERLEIEQTYGYHFNKIDEKYDLKYETLNKKINNIKTSDNYNEYLKLSIDNFLDICLSLEENEVFQYLLKENFNNLKIFNNEPYIKLFNFTIQPRYWKFKKIANLLATNFKFKNYESMFDTWKNLRISYKSLQDNNESISYVINRGRKLENEIEEINNKLDNLIIKKSNEVYKDIINMFSFIPLSKIDNKNIIKLRENIDINKKRLYLNEDDSSKILNNINKIEDMIDLVRKGYVINNDTLNKFRETTDVTEPIFEEISNKDWENIKIEFKNKGINLKDNKNDYSVVKTKLTKKEKNYYLDKYNVKEGEIFIDENLINK